MFFFRFLTKQKFELLCPMVLKLYRVLLIDLYRVTRNELGSKTVKKLPKKKTKTNQILSEEIPKQILVKQYENAKDAELKENYETKNGKNKAKVLVSTI
ncbi:hypothetical protein NQ317_008461 [Molorchus minor]|uniref:Uncharacterized protein n=1 Tax=Molorchus minor TaxID=1323400 RepID=A0ABQ9JE62_9CUCU|nr:hypothetical protein NQ317_008461 [Molorchus minor]